ncbi:MAG: S8 family serine peptidase [Planctomycetota bacterium]
MPHAACRLAAPLLLLAGSALGQVAADRDVGPVLEPQPLRASVVTGIGAMRLRIATPDARESVAAVIDRAGDKPLPAQGQPAEGQPADAQPATYTLGSRVIVKASPAALARLEAEGYEVDRFDPLPGYAFVSSHSVAGAIDLARRLRDIPGVGRATVELGRTFRSRTVPTDPRLQDAWHLINDQRPGEDINARGAWLRGYTGQGVTVGVVDEGVFSVHEDLIDNRDGQLMQSGTVSFHGTAVAGIIAAAADNGLGAAGIAYNATFGTQLYGRFGPTEEDNAEALLFRNDLINIKNNSWGPLDNRAFHPLDPLEADALETGATTGRGGLGTVFVWAAGNGSFNDRPEYDGFANSRHTIAIGAVGHLGQRASYNERGSAMTAVAYSDGNTDDDNIQRDIFTTRWPPLGDDNYGLFGGTSAAAPLATGVIALALEANPQLTARDVQKLIVNTARIIDEENTAWSTNAAGWRFNDNYGFGMLDAEAMVIAAETWTNVGPPASFAAGTVASNTPVPDNDPAAPVEIEFDIPVQLRVEHAEIRVRMAGDNIGDIRLELVGPAGTVSTIAETRTFRGDDMDHLFTSVRHWDELAAGTWTLRATDGREGDVHTLLDAALTIHGTCAADQNRDGTTDAADFQAWVSNFQSGNADADMNGDATVDGSDFFAWVHYSRIGC